MSGFILNAFVIP